MVDSVEHMVVVKLSAWAHAWEDKMDAETMALFDALTAQLQ